MEDKKIAFVLGPEKRGTFLCLTSFLHLTQMPCLSIVQESNLKMVSFTAGE